MSRDGKCLIWHTPAKLDDPDGRDGTVVDSPRAGGRYFITGSASAGMSGLNIHQRIALISYLVRQRRLGNSCPEISSHTLEVIKKAPPTPVLDRADDLLRFVHLNSQLLGDVTKFYAVDNTKNPEAIDRLLAFTGSKKPSEAITLAEFCQEKGWLGHKVTERTGGSTNTVHEIMLKPQGYARLEELAGANPLSKQAFVAMWFDASMEEVYLEGFDPAIRDCGYDPLRIDQKEHIQKVDDQIIAEIRRSRFVVADFTSEEDKPRGGVYYEAGFAQGLNIPVIWTCREDRIEKVHFDTRQFNHIVWKKPADLKKKLSTRISAVLGDGPLKIM